MRLKDWVEGQGRGALTRLQLRTGIAYATILALSKDKHSARYQTAVKLSAATGGAVSIAELCAPPPEPKKKKGAKRRLASAASAIVCPPPPPPEARP
jgi:hypothetical protein